MDLAGLIDGEQGTARLPVPAYLIEHAGSVLVFDAGLHTDFRDGQSRRVGEAAGIRCILPEGTDLAERLRECGVDPDDVDLLALSHLHFDHVGGSPLVAKAELVVQRAEWDAALADVDGENYMSVDLDRDRRLRLLDGEWDVFGDGRVTLVPTTGHTAGHQSLRVRTDDGAQLVLCGDACYFMRSLRLRALPPQAFDRTSQLEGLDRLRQFEVAGARLIFGHDPEQWPTGPGDDRIVELSSPDCPPAPDLEHPLHTPRFAVGLSLTRARDQALTWRKVRSGTPSLRGARRDEGICEGPL
jgi:glyoxylase-like metal-dependent hydrolase (beta-lactamase superfamily II)